MTEDWIDKLYQRYVERYGEPTTLEHDEEPQRRPELSTDCAQHESEAAITAPPPSTSVQPDQSPTPAASFEQHQNGDTAARQPTPEPHHVALQCTLQNFAQQPTASPAGSPIAAPEEKTGQPDFAQQAPPPTEARARRRT